MKKQRKITSVVIITAIAFITMCYYLFYSIKKNKSSESNSNPSIEIVFGGDIDFGDRYHTHKKQKIKNCVIKEKGYAYSFSEIITLLKSGDFLVANLETPISKKTEKNRLDSIKKYLHWCNEKEAINTLKELNFNYLSLANNHTLDQGIEGLNNTFDLLSKANITYFGAGKNEKEASKPIAIKDKLKRTIYLVGGFEYREPYENEYLFYAEKTKIGVNKWDVDEAQTQIKKIKTNDPNSIIIAFPHWGANYKWKNWNQKHLGKLLIDAGTDIIIGHGAHKFQEIEKVNGHWIFYSLGNLVMNSTGRYRKKKATPYSFIVKLKISESKNDLIMESKIYPILSDNKVSNYKPSFVSKSEIEFIRSTLIKKAPILTKKLKIKNDSIGYYLNLKLN